ncbi:protein of unknown function (plasmid) [Caballeronia sp. S22]
MICADTSFFILNSQSIKTGSKGFRGAMSVSVKRASH